MSHPVDEFISALVTGLESPQFDRLLMDRLKGFVSSDLAMISVYRADRLEDCATDAQLPAETREAYKSSTYRHSPFFQHHLRGFRDGVYRMEDLALTNFIRIPAADSDVLVIDPGEEVGYVTWGWPKRLKELDVAVRLSATQTAQISLYRAGSRFSDKDVARIANVQKSLCALFTKRWAAQRGAAAPNVHLGKETFDALASPLLSPREYEVVRLAVAGSSAKQIARELGIGGETVRTHTKRAYAKLGVSTRVELYARLLSSSTPAA